MKFCYGVHPGIHAREWIAPASCVYVINYLLTNYAADAAVRSLVDGVTWYIVPSANPDGYEYSHRYDRMWRKTRTPNPGFCTSLRCSFEGIFQFVCFSA